VGLIADLGARPLKGPGTPGRVAVVNPMGGWSRPWKRHDCVRVDGLFGAVRRRTTILRGWRSPAGMVDGSNILHPLSRPSPPPVWRSSATACSEDRSDYTLPAAPFSLRPAAVRSRATPCWRLPPGGGVAIPQMFTEAAECWLQRDGAAHMASPSRAIGTVRHSVGAPGARRPRGDPLRFRAQGTVRAHFQILGRHTILQRNAGASDPCNGRANAAFWRQAPSWTSIGGARCSPSAPPWRRADAYTNG